MKNIEEKKYTIKYEDIDNLEFENLLEEDFNDIEKFLDSYIVKKVDEYKIDSTIEVLREYMPQEVIEIENKAINKLNNIKSSVNLIKLQIGTMNKFYWMGSLLLILCGMLSIKNSNVNLIVCTTTVAPIPVLLGLAEFIKGRNENVWELELSYKYSLREIMLAKLIIVASVSICTIFIMSLITTNIYAQINLITVLSIWVIPMCVVSSISLLIVSIYRSMNSVILCIGIWMLGVAIFMIEGIYERFIDISNMAMMAILAISIISVIVSVKVFYKRCINYKDYRSFDF